MAKVYLYVYDLSRGMAKAMSLPLTGKQIDGIWHTAVVVYGKEYAFGQGIEEFQPGVTHYGQTVEQIFMGETQIPKDVFLEFMETMKTVWTADKYHLLDNNCNSFSDEVCQFLVGKGIPAHITGLPAEFLNTPFGQMIRPNIEAIFGQSRHASSVQPLAASSSSAAVITKCTNLSVLQDIIKNNRCVVVDFTSQNCGPCRVIAPKFEDLIEEKKNQGVAVAGVSVETSVARDICQVYGISATPTFKFFLDGKVIEEVRGADFANLKANLDMLLYTAYPPHKHESIKLESILTLLQSKPASFNVSSNLSMIFGKLNSFLVNEDLKRYFDSLQTIKNSMESSASPFECALTTSQLDVVFETLCKLTADQMFPLLDVARLLVLNSESQTYVIRKNAGYNLDKLLTNVLSFKNSGKATNLMVMKLICNLFPNVYDYSTVAVLLSTQKSELEKSRRELITEILIANLLSEDVQLRQAAALLAFNIGWAITQGRKILKQRLFEYDEDWSLELVAALCDAISKETEVKEKNDETTFRLVSALGFHLLLTSEPVVELAVVVGVQNNVKQLKLSSESERATTYSKLETELFKIFEKN